MNYGKYEGQLCRMLEEPEQVTVESKMFLTRLIQDDSNMGKQNKQDFSACALAKRTLVLSIDMEAFPNTINSYYEPFNQRYYWRFEVIGYPVTKGSAHWALYQMMQGNRVTKSHLSHTYWQYDARPNLKCISEYNCGTLQIRVLPEIWLTTAEPTGWQIYKEPKPLLAKAKVGDLCQRRDGKWVQIDRLLSIGGMPWICYEIGGLRYINNGEQLNSKLSELGIISTEPLAPEGTAEWAWQMQTLILEIMLRWKDKGG